MTEDRITAAILTLAAAAVALCFAARAIRVWDDD